MTSFDNLAIHLIKFPVDLNKLKKLADGFGDEATDLKSLNLKSLDIQTIAGNVTETVAELSPIDLVSVSNSKWKYFIQIQTVSRSIVLKNPFKQSDFKSD